MEKSTSCRFIGTSAFNIQICVKHSENAKVAKKYEEHEGISVWGKIEKKEV